MEETTEDVKSERKSKFCFGVDKELVIFRNIYMTLLPYYNIAFTKLRPLKSYKTKNR